MSHLFVILSNLQVRVVFVYLWNKLVQKLLVYFVMVYPCFSRFRVHLCSHVYSNFVNVCWFTSYQFRVDFEFHDFITPRIFTYARSHVVPYWRVILVFLTCFNVYEGFSFVTAVDDQKVIIICVNNFRNVNVLLVKLVLIELTLHFWLLVDTFFWIVIADSLVVWVSEVYLGAFVCIVFWAVKAMTTLHNSVPQVLAHLLTHRNLNGVLALVEYSLNLNAVAPGVVFVEMGHVIHVYPCTLESSNIKWLVHFTYLTYIVRTKPWLKTCGIEIWTLLARS